MTSVSSLTGRESLFAPPAYTTGAWCNGDEERGTPLPTSPEVDEGVEGARAHGEGAGEDYFDYSPDERDGAGVGGHRGRLRARASRLSAHLSDDEGLAARLGRCFGGWEALRAVTCRCFDDPIFGDAGGNGNGGRQQSETKSLGKSLGLSSGGVTVAGTNSATVDTTKETAGTASGEAGTRVRSFLLLLRFLRVPFFLRFFRQLTLSFACPSPVPGILEEEQPERARVEAREQGERRADLLRAAGDGEIIGVYNDYYVRMRETHRFAGLPPLVGCKRRFE